MADNNWKPDKILDLYIHDYLVKRNLHNTAKIFKREAKVTSDSVAIDEPDGFLLEWWSVFWDIFMGRRNEKHSEAAAACGEQHNAQLQQRDPNHLPLVPMNSINSGGMVGQLSAINLAMKMYEERMKLPSHLPLVPMNSTNSGGMVGQQSAGNLDTKMYEERMKLRSPLYSKTSASLKDASRLSQLKYKKRQMMQGYSGSMPVDLQQMQGRPQNKNLGELQKFLPMDLSSIYRQAILESNCGLGGAELSQGLLGLPLKGWPLTGIDHLSSSLGLQEQEPNLQTQNQILLSSQQQQVLAEAQALGNLGNLANFGFGGLPRSNLNAKDGQPPRNDESICSPAESSSEKKKRNTEQHSSSRPVNSICKGNTVGPSPGSSQSTHTPGDGLATASSMQHVNSNMPQSMMMYGAQGTGGIASSTNQPDELKTFESAGSFKDDCDIFSHDKGDENPHGSLKQTLSEHKTETSKGFTFGEVGCIRAITKLTCCHFSTDGKLLAVAGHDKKVDLWNMTNLHSETTPAEHQDLITDVRFQPYSTQFATTSFDKSVRLWDAANPSYCLHAYTGHSSYVMSLDFHPKKNDLFCFCNNINEIHYWSISPFSCTRVSKQGGSEQVRFQPISGHLLAAASDEVVSIFDVENDKQTLSFQGHSSKVNCLCWDLAGDLLASMSGESIKVYSLASGECIHELNANGNQFHSCVFHPSSSAHLVIGGLRSLELWNMAENKSITVPAHENIVSGLAGSPLTGFIASVSDDSLLKLWK